jgi:fatty-acyl-CoA synthase
VDEVPVRAVLSRKNVIDRSMDTIAHHLLARAGDPRPGLLSGDRSWTWAEVVETSAQRAAWLAEVRQGGPFHVALLLDNVPDFCFWLGATALAGAVVVGANPTHRGSELARDLAHTRCQLLVTDTAHLPLVEGLDLGPALGVASATNPRVVVVDDPGPPPDARSSGGLRPGPAVAEDALGYLIFTSGTSGAPKACRCTQGRMARIGATVAQMYELVPEDVCYVAMPLFHSNALMAGWSPALAAGATVALPTGGRFSASGFLPDVRRHHVTYFNYVGKPLSYILATAPRPDDTDNTLRRVFGNEGAEDDVARFAERFGCRVVDSYGSTEGGATVQRTPDTPHGALGRAPEGTMVVDPETGEECPVARFDAEGRLTNAEEAVGELVSASGAAGFEGYWDNEEAEEARLRNGWYWTGDLAYRDEKGFFYFAGRSDDWLRVDGENFAAAPVARVLARHPDVVVAAVYAVPDPVSGDQVMAAIELRPGAAFDPEGFAAFLAAQTDMGTKWVPRFVRVSSSLPKTATSKLLTRALRLDSWHGPDPVYWSPDRAPRLSYRLLQPADVARLDEVVAGRAPAR